MSSSKKKKRTEFVERLLALGEFEFGALTAGPPLPPQDAPSKPAVRYAQYLVGALAPERTASLARKVERLKRVTAAAASQSGATHGPTKAHG